MMQVDRFLRGGACAVACLTGVFLAAAPGARATHAQLLHRQEQTVTAADGTPLTLTRGVVRVPELRGKGGSGGTIDLAVVRIARAAAGSSPAARRPAHVLLAGGPGDSGVNLVTGLARQGGALLFDLLGGDLIGIDQRGTGQSSPNLQSRVLYNLPLDRPGSPDTWRPLIEQATRSVAADLRARGVRLEAYNTRESADDVDAVRRAFGDDRIVLWGRSYGSHLALATLRQHPGTIERVVLVSPEGPDHTFKLPSQVDAALRRLSDRAAQDPRVGARVPDLTALVRQVLERLTREPVFVDVPHPVSGQPTRVGLGAFDVQWLTAQALGDPRTAATLPAAYLEMSQGDFRRLAVAAIARRSRLGVESAMKQVMDLGSGATPARRARIAREAKTALLGNAINLPLMDLAAAWGNPDLADAFRQPVRSDVPVLLLVGDLDPRTPVENAREIAATLPNGQLVVVEHATHQFDFFGSASIRTLLGEFLRGAPLSTRSVAMTPLAFQDVR